MIKEQADYRPVPRTRCCGNCCYYDIPGLDSSKCNKLRNSDMIGRADVKAICVCDLHCFRRLDISRSPVER